MSKCILVVDDDAMNLKRTKMILERQYKVLLAESGREALDKIKTEEIDLVLLDIAMPVGTLFIMVSAGDIAALAGVASLPVHPFVEGAAVIEHTVYDHPHPTAMNLLHEPGKELVAGRQILRVGTAQLIAGGSLIGTGVRRHILPTILYDHPIMGINVIIILGVILMIGRRHKQRIKINDFHV